MDPMLIFGENKIHDYHYYWKLWIVAAVGKMSDPMLVCGLLLPGMFTSWGATTGLEKHGILDRDWLSESIYHDLQ